MNTTNSILAITPLGMHWATLDPFLFCAHHLDVYPEGNDKLGPAASLEGRQIGSDFGGKDGWSMYHGDVVPGFPRHPHRGFETITVTRQGLMDHADSMGAKARFGQGDVQWMTAGNGVVHSEMFPLLNTEKPNPRELFQIWLNLPAQDKRSDAYFTMFWHETIPTLNVEDADGNAVKIRVIAGELQDLTPLSPPPSSWAARPDANVAVWTLTLDPGATFEMPKIPAGANRVLYFFEGSTLEVDGHVVEAGHAIQVDPASTVTIRAGAEPAELLVLQGTPIGEPVVQHGPFVMNTAQEIRQTMHDYHRTQFGGWPFENDGPTHPKNRGRFAIHADGREENPG